MSDKVLLAQFIPWMYFWYQSIENIFFSSQIIEFLIQQYHEDSKICHQIYCASRFILWLFISIHPHLISLSFSDALLLSILICLPISTHFLSIYFSIYLHAYSCTYPLIIKLLHTHLHKTQRVDRWRTALGAICVVYASNKTWCRQFAGDS